jgi:nucleotide-binding universal stress UspA family protein
LIPGRRPRPLRPAGSHLQVVRDANPNATDARERVYLCLITGMDGQEGYTLIIVGKHGRNRVAGKLIGSTAARICEVARRPVLMMPLQEA